MPIVTTNFVRGRMNKSVDERLLPPGEYVNAINVRLGSTESTEIGAVENSKGNTKLTTLQYENADLTDATCIGAYDDGANETIYWFITSTTVDMIVSFDTKSELITYHVVSVSVLNFDTKHLINSVNKIGDLLFFTDDINPPRKINVNRNYPSPASGADVLTDKELNVIVQPPLAAPTFNLISQATEANYMETRMISFAYRYKYQDDEYSALSQFTDIAFVPGVFKLDIATNLNSGMKNIYNAVELSFNTGDSNVVGVDLIFKFADSNVLNVIERFNKSNYGWPDNTIQTQTFSNSKIYTILPDSELLRLYDNVPRTAKAQTLMGNRLVYGNYVDGYNMVDSDGNSCQMTFEAERVSANIETNDFTPTLVGGVQYTIDTPENIANSTISVDLSDIATKLKSGAVLDFDFTFISSKFTGNSGTITTSQPSTDISTIFTLAQDFTSVFEMVTSVDFKTRIGSEPAYFTTVVNACTNGTSLTDIFNCAVTNPGDSNSAITWLKSESGISGLNQGIRITAQPGSNIVTFQIPAMKFVDSNASIGISAPLYEYYKFTSGEVLFLGNGNTKSLHSNRNYEVGVVYMDEYLRSSTALVSPDNTIFTPASTSNQKNQIKVTIPVTQKPPYWASKYKFVVKRAEGPYETIYSNFYYRDTTTNTVYFKLEGQNQTKVRTGEILRVKADTFGPLSNYQTQEVLSVDAKEQNFLTPAANIESGGVEPYISELSGLYMELKPTNFNVDTSEDSSAWSSGTESDQSRRNYPSIQIPCFRDRTSSDINVEVPEGSLVTFDFEFFRSERNNNAGSEIYNYNKTFQASNDYDNLYDFVVGEAIDFTGGTDTSTDDSGANQNIFINENPLPSKSIPGRIQGKNQYRFSTTNGGAPSTGTGQTNFLYLALKSGTRGVGGHPSRVKGRIAVQVANSIITFESIPVDVDNDIYYEDDACYDITGGFHTGTTQTQTSTLPAISTLGFFDCFSFGNGVESFKVEDSLIGQSFTLGQRVTSVSDQDYKEADRFAGMTYSGLYSEESNINRLNEFNLGLANFKDCEVIYGPIEVLHSRETDIMCLQEDKISYVLAQKDVLTTAAGGGALSASPLILGQQVARIEEYGISSNPESFASHGDSMYFTDAKRNAVIQLKGAGRQQALVVISELGMRSYFRDLFTQNFNKQKLGGFDPYMNEYVLSSSVTNIPSSIVPLSCGTLISRQSVTNASSYSIDFGNAQGVVSFDYNVTGTVTLLVVWDNGTVINQSITGSGSQTFNKTKANPSTATVTITPSASVTYEITPQCPVTNEIVVVQITLGSPVEDGKFIHNQYYWNKGTLTSPVSSELVRFNSADPVESFISTTGQTSVGIMPVSGASITMQSNKKDFDDFVFDASVDKFKYLVSSIEYIANDWAIIDAASTNVTPITNPSTGLYQASFTYTNGSPITDKYLYMIWDYRNVTNLVLRDGSTELISCCSGSSATYYIDTDSFATATAVWTDSNLYTKAANQFYQATSIVREQSAGLLLPSVTCAPCGTAIPLCSSTTGASDICCTGCTYSSYSSSIMKSLRSEACGLAQDQTYYHNGTGTTPVVNNFVYSNNTGTTLLAAGYYSLSATSVIYVNSSGMVENLLTC